jgi:lipopolysaccharide biosynthesis glycosyltransferase
MNTFSKTDTMKNPDYIPLFFHFNEAYVQHAMVAMASVLHNTDSKLKIHILSSDISEDSLGKINALGKIKNAEVEHVVIDRKRFEKITPTIGRIPIEACYRLLIPELWPTLRKGIYLDSDLVVRGDIARLWEEDVLEVYAGVVEDLMPETKIRFTAERYFNSGVLLLNLEKIRDDFSLEKFLAIEEEFRDVLQYQDQDILNLAFKNHVRYLDKRWNVTTLFYMELVGKHVANEEEIQRAASDPWICHFIGQWKPWDFPASDFPEKYIADYFKYLALTPFSGKRNSIFRNYRLYAPLRFLVDILRFVKHHPCFFLKRAQLGQLTRMFFSFWRNLFRSEKLFHQLKRDDSHQ